MEIYDDLLEIFTYVLTLLGILNPFGNVPLFIGLTKEQDSETRKKMYNTIVLSGLGILTGFIFVGDFLMQYLYKVGIGEFRVAGGLILIVVAFRNLLGVGKKQEATEKMPESEAIRYAITPLTFPILVGPGTISTVMIIHKEAGLITALVAVIVTFIIMKILFSISNLLNMIFGEIVLFVVSRVMQIFIMSSGVKLVTVGIKEIFSI